MKPNLSILALTLAATTVIAGCGSNVTNDSYAVADCLQNAEIPLSGNIDTDRVLAEVTLKSCLNNGQLNKRAYLHGIRITYDVVHPSKLYNCVVNVNIARQRRDTVDVSYAQCGRFFREPSRR